jgi:hypothetical protein
VGEDSLEESKLQMDEGYAPAHPFCHVSGAGWTFHHQFTLGAARNQKYRRQKRRIGIEQKARNGSGHKRRDVPDDPKESIKYSRAETAHGPSATVNRHNPRENTEISLS